MIKIYDLTTLSKLILCWGLLLAVGSSVSTEAKCQENHYEEMLENEPMARTRVVKLCFPPHIQNRVSPLAYLISWNIWNDFGFWTCCCQTRAFKTIKVIISYQEPAGRRCAPNLTHFYCTIQSEQYWKL